jgi:hypothetical protein
VLLLSGLRRGSGVVTIKTRRKRLIFEWMVRAGQRVSWSACGLSCVGRESRRTRLLMALTKGTFLGIIEGCRGCDTKIANAF